jgi:hypothetical protein
MSGRAPETSGRFAPGNAVVGAQKCPDKPAKKTDIFALYVYVGFSSKTVTASSRYVTDVFSVTISN